MDGTDLATLDPPTKKPGVQQPAGDPELDALGHQAGVASAPSSKSGSDPEYDALGQQAGLHTQSGPIVTPDKDVTGAQLSGWGGAANTFMDAALHGATAGLSNKILPAMSAAAGNGSYDTQAAQYQQERAQQQQAHGTANTLGEITGQVLSPINWAAGAVGGLARGLGAVGRAGQAAVTGGTMLGAQKAIEAQPGERGWEGVKGFIEGAPLGFGADLAVNKVLGPIGRGLARSGIIGDNTGPESSVGGMIDQLQASKVKQADKAYTVARGLPDITNPDVIRQVETDPHFRQAYELAQKADPTLPNLGAAPLTELPAVLRSGDPVKDAAFLQDLQQRGQSNTKSVESLPVRGIDLMKRAMTELMNQGEFGDPHGVVGSQINANMRKLLANVDEEAPLYGQARAGVTAHEKLIKAITPENTNPPSYSILDALGTLTGQKASMARLAKTFLERSAAGTPAGASDAIKAAGDASYVNAGQLAKLRKLIPLPYTQGMPGSAAAAGLPAGLLEALKARQGTPAQ